MRLSQTLVAGLALAALATVPATAQAQRKASLEARAGLAVPTFDIADVAKAGPVFGAGLQLPLNDRWSLLADVDFGSHEVKGTTLDVNVNHYMTKLGYVLGRSQDGKLEFLVNLGAGLMTFGVDAPGAETRRYFAINAGAKLYYQFSRSLGLVISPQGDIAFQDSDDFGASTAWVWPVSAGLRITF